MDDLGKQFQQFYNKTKQTLDKFPVLAASTAENFFHDSFNQQGWSGETQQPWAKRKTDKNKKDSGRAILVKSGRLNRSIRKIKADWNGIIVGTNLPYAGIHNDGFRGKEQVNQHFRIASRKVMTRYLKNGKASKAKDAFKKVQGSGHEVKAHSRQMNMPRRRFIGNSPYLDKRIERIFLNELTKI
jgi:phage gpG-like protein